MSEQSKVVNVSELFSSFNQSVICVLFKIYRVLVSTLLIVFVPKNCSLTSDNGTVTYKLCTFSDNLHPHNRFEFGGIVVNFVALALFLGLHIAEEWREQTLQSYLAIHGEVSVDALDEKSKKHVFFSHKVYKVATLVTGAVFIGNTIISGIIVHGKYLGDETYSTFVTNILFITPQVLKAIDVIRHDTAFQSIKKSKVFYSFVKDDLQEVILEQDKKEGSV